MFLFFFLKRHESRNQPMTNVKKKIIILKNEWLTRETMTIFFLFFYFNFSFFPKKCLEEMWQFVQKSTHKAAVVVGRPRGPLFTAARHCGTARNYFPPPVST
jgi:hypothetical protein